MFLSGFVLVRRLLDLLKHLPKLGSAGEFSKFLAPKLSGKWSGPNCTLDVYLTGDIFTAKGEYKQSNGLLGAFTIGGPYTTDYREEYSGKVYGRAIEGRVSRKDEKGEARGSTLLAGVDSDPSVLMLLSKDGKEIRVLEQLGGTAKFYSLTRQA
jgi:hypothetical protein